MEWLRRIWYLLNRRRFEGLMADEMAHHREMMEHEGRQDFGSTLRLNEDAREVWGWMWLDRLWQDLTYGARVLRKSPGFTVTAVVVLALGIGVTLTAVRMVLQEIRPSAAPDPDTLVHLDRRSPGNHSTLVAYPMLAFYAGHATSFRSVIGRLDTNLTFGGDSETVPTAFVTANYFSEFGIQAAMGRVLAPAIDEAAGVEPVALLGQRFWQRRLGGNAAVIGQLIRVAGKPVRIVGIVAAPRERTAVWMPLVKQPYVVEGSTLLTGWDSGLSMFGRLKPGVGLRASEEETRTLATALREERPQDVWKEEWLAASPINSLHIEDASALLVAATLVLLLLIVACTNLGTLMLARGVAREREIWTRMSLGAGRGRVVRQLLTESVLLAFLSSLAALLLSTIAIKVIQIRMDASEDWTLAPDWRVLLATMAIAFLSAVSFGLAPALRITSGAPHAGRPRKIFLTVQVGASCVLLMLSGLLVRSFERLIASDPGFDYRQLVVIQPGLREHGYQGPAALSYMEALRTRLLSIPGVQRACLMELALWGHESWEDHRNGYRFNLNRVDAEFVPTLGLRLSRGRNFRPGEQGVAIVGESVARLQWPGEDPLGKRLPTGDRDTVIGVIRKARTSNPRNDEAMGIYFPPKGKDWAGSTLVVRVTGPPGNFVGLFSSAAKALDQRLQPSVHSLDSEYQEAIRTSLQLASTVGSLGMLATLLSAIGLAGLTAYTVGQRTREIGVRIALGARRPQIVRAVLSSMFWPVTAGFAGGMLGATAISLVLRREIFGFRLLDPPAYIAAIAFFLAVIALATMAPARRAIRVNPSEALRHE